MGFGLSMGVGEERVKTMLENARSESEKSVMELINSFKKQINDLMAVMEKKVKASDEKVT